MTSSGPAGILSREDAGRQSLVLVFTVKPALHRRTRWPVRAVRWCDQRPDGEPSLPLTYCITVFKVLANVKAPLVFTTRLCDVQILLLLNGQNEDQRGKVICQRTHSQWQNRIPGLSGS